ncbi:regulator of chromosome condensation 1/beta-lactamase-inhibitor protein II [Syncephalis plumigaleata]|nr:regulator of chromosome condensation 1/beta-lactamase-inhibitor protein II [Syncephalis plumigaleata]
MFQVLGCGFNRFNQLGDASADNQQHHRYDRLQPVANAVNVIASTWSDTLVVVVDRNDNELDNNLLSLCLYGDHVAMANLPDYPDNNASSSTAIQYAKLLSNGQYLQLDRAGSLTITAIYNGNAKNTKYLGQYQAVAVSDEEQITVIKDGALHINDEDAWHNTNDDSATIKLKKISMSDVVFVKVVAGYGHWLALTKNGDLYSWGSNRFGQLGHGDTQDRCEPCLVESLHGIKVVEIACGTFHSAVITEFGDLYTFGWDNRGQLGLSNSTDIELGYPNCVDLPTDKNVRKVACGEGHTVIVFDDDTVWSCGWNKYGQLGHSPGNEQSVWKSIDIPVDSSTAAVERCICGPWTTFLILNITA